MTVSDPGLILPESACRWPQVFHTQGIRLCPMTLFNPVFNCLTPIVIKRSKTQAEEGLAHSSRRSWLCRSASAPSQQACEPVQDRCSGPCSRPRHAAAWRSRKRAPAGWVAVEATSRPRQFGYETPQLRLERRLHAGSPYRSNDLVSAGPEPPLSCDLRLNHAVNSRRGRTHREGPQSVCRRPRRGHSEVHGAAGEGHSEAFALSPGTSASCAGAHRGKPRSFRTVVGSKSYDNPIMGAGFTSPLPDRTALSRRNRNGTGPLPGTHSHRRG